MFIFSVFKNSTLDHFSRYSKEGFEIHGQQEGTVMGIRFSLDGQSFSTINGGPVFQFNEAISLQVYCDTQEEIDYYWDKLTEKGVGVQCGWLKDQFDVSWQVVPTVLEKLLNDPSRANRVTKGFLQMKKFDIEKLKSA
ncbi:MAG: VOC family protein [Saprospiraceae bacterium]|nr:VOC family protein [Saprospiraceae bacterium]